MDAPRSGRSGPREAPSSRPTTSGWPTSLNRTLSRATEPAVEHAGRRNAAGDCSNCIRRETWRDPVPATVPTSPRGLQTRPVARRRAAGAEERPRMSHRRPGVVEGVSDGVLPPRVTDDTMHNLPLSDEQGTCRHAASMSTLCRTAIASPE